MTRINNSIVLLIAVAVLVSCKKRNPEAPYTGIRYYPLSTGNYIVYNVDSIVYDAFYQSVDTQSFKMKVAVGDPYTDAEGNPGFKIQRYYQLSDTLDFVLRDVWYARKNKVNAEQVEENKRYVKLAFPPREGDSWNGNSKNDLEPWYYYIKDLHVARTYNGLVFDSTLTVVQYDDESQILTERKYSEEKYASGVGLVYHKKEWIDKVYDNTTSQFVPADGYVLEWTIVDYKIN